MWLCKSLKREGVVTKTNFQFDGVLYKYDTTHRATNECGIRSVSSPPRLMGRVVVTFRSYSFEFYR